MSIEQEFVRILGRKPTNAENAFFSKFISDGQLDPFEIGQILEASPEAIRGRIPQQTQEYGQQLAQADDYGLNRAQDQLMSRYYQQGRPASSGYAAAFANAARDLAAMRQSKVADFYGQGVGMLNQAYSRGGGIQDRGYGLRDEQRKRNWEIEDYYRQQNDFNTYLNAQNRRNRNQGMVGAIGSLGGAAIGGYFGGPAGAQVGSRVGGSFGQFAQ